jgi:NAD(P)-dependent dehydrogenase (short-subunit alcohol dehydrogenase family)
MIDSIDGQIVMITGAAGNLGQAIAQAFQTAGAGTVLVDRSTQRLRSLYGDIVDDDRHLLAGEIDLSSEQAVQDLVSAVIARFGRVDVLVNTVGAFRGGQASHEEPLETLDFLTAVNVRTALICSRTVIPHMLASESGRIVNIISRNAFQGSANYGAYSAVKAALLRLTESMAAELKDRGINVNCVVPGTMDTPQNREAMPNADHSRWVAPAAVADVILFCASDAARAVSGTAIPAYGRS